MAQAEACLLGPQEGVLLVDETGREMARAGLAVPQAGYAVLPLVIDGRKRGELRGVQSEAGAGRLKFLWRALQALIDSEHARRAVSQETLGQYHELALLQRAAIALNEKLHPQRVAEALLELVRETQSPETAGGCYLLAGDAPVLAASFGGFPAAEALSLEVPLVRAVLAARRPEIVNHLAGDARWQGAPPCEHLLLAPVSASEAAEALVILTRPRGAPEFQASDLKGAATLASMAAGALRNARLFEEMFEIKNYTEGVLKSLSNGVIALDRSGVVTKVNPAAARILGLQEAEILDRPLADVLHSDNRWLLDAVSTVRETRRADAHPERELRLPDRRPVNLNLLLEPLCDIDEQPMGVLLVLEDLTRERRLRNTMSRFMTDQVVDQLLAGDDSFLGGKEQEVSILFSDIRRFTSLSEHLSPVDAVGQLNEYFAGMVDIIFEHHGTLDKFIGDGIMALFGAPFVSSGDADNAVAAAVAMMEHLQTFNRSRAKQGLTPFNIGVGVNTGPVIVGNIGSPKRMDFTVIGDHVNLAARLESANKFYGSKILFSEHTRDALRRSHAIRELDKVRVMGRQQPVRIFEVLDHYTSADFPQMGHILRCFGEGVEAFRERRFSEAAKAFGEVVRIKPDDKPAVIYLQRCLEYGEREPPTNWDAVVDLASK